MNYLKCFEMVDDIWSEILSRADKVSSVCFKYASKATYAIGARIEINSLISSYDLGRSGSVNIVKWAIENGGLKCEHPKELEAIYLQRYTHRHSTSPIVWEKSGLGCVRSGATKIGAVGLLKWLKRCKICPHDNYPAVAVQYGFLDIVRTIGFTNRALEQIAIRHGQLGALRILGMKNKPDIARSAALYGQLEILEAVGVQDPLSVALAAAEGGHPSILSWMKENVIPYYRINHNFVASMAAKSGKVSVLRWLVEEIPSYVLDSSLIGVAGRNKQIETARWLVEHLGITDV